jgi:hypothetical protein
MNMSSRSRLPDYGTTQGVANASPNASNLMQRSTLTSTTTGAGIPLPYQPTVGGEASLGTAYTLCLRQALAVLHVSALNVTGGAVEAQLMMSLSSNMSSPKACGEIVALALGELHMPIDHALIEAFSPGPNVWLALKISVPSSSSVVLEANIDRA